MPKNKINEKQKRARLTARIMAAIDRAIASPHCEDGGLANCVASFIITHGNCGDTYDGTDWTPQAHRAVLLAYAANAPFGDLAAMAKTANDMVSWCEWWDREQWLNSWVRSDERLLLCDLFEEIVTKKLTPRHLAATAKAIRKSINAEAKETTDSAVH